MARGVPYETLPRPVRRRSSSWLLRASGCALVPSHSRTQKDASDRALGGRGMFSMGGRPMHIPQPFLRGTSKVLPSTTGINRCSGKLRVGAQSGRHSSGRLAVFIVHWILIVQVSFEVYFGCRDSCHTIHIVLLFLKQ